MLRRKGSGEVVTVGDSVVDGNGKRYYIESIRGIASQAKPSRSNKTMIRAVSMCSKKQRVHAGPEYFNLQTNTEYYRAGWGEVTITEGEKHGLS